ncbi:MAG: sugar ABC transporter permease [Spirochaetaceae bacterium]|nr:MAG: sugar ABC transporter permease [Spirochaetaceae bacterium]
MKAEKGTVFIFVLPTLIFLLLIFVYPLFFGVYLSLHSTREGLRLLSFVGLRNYATVLTSELFWWGVRNTVIYTVGTVGLTVGLGLAIAVLLNRIKSAVWLYRALLILPLGVSPVVTGMTWQMMFDPLSGIINHLLSLVGLPTSLWHTGFRTAMASVIIIESWQWIPFPLFVIYAGLQMMPQEPFEAATIDGATAFQQIRYITLPLIAPILGLATTLRFIGAFRSFDILYVVTKGGPGRATDTLILQAFMESFSYYRFEYGLVVGKTMLVVTLIVSIILVNKLTRQVGS